MRAERKELERHGCFHSVLCFRYAENRANPPKKKKKEKNVLFLFLGGGGCFCCGHSNLNEKCVILLQFSVFITAAVAYGNALFLLRRRPAVIVEGSQ